MKVQLDHLNMTVNSFKETSDWYGKLFGFEIVEQGTRDGQPWGILRRDETMLCIYEVEGKAKSKRHDHPSQRQYRINHFGLRIADKAFFEELLQQHKIKTYYDSPVRYPHSLSWYVLDPSGHEIEVALWDGDQLRFG
jgi:catechol 2,3-dioxygenase-like lactoylglutathione lyase family enzyme